MLLAQGPPAGIAFLVRPGVNTEAVLLVVTVETFVHAPVLPGVDSKFVHNVALPMPDVFPAIRPLIEAVAAYLVVVPLSFVAGPVGPHILA